MASGQEYYLSYYKSIKIILCCARPHVAGACFSKVGPENQLSNCNPLVFKSWSFNMFLMLEKPRGYQSLMAQNPRRCEDIKGIVTPEIGPKCFGIFEKQAPVFRPLYLTFCTDILSHISHLLITNLLKAIIISTLVCELIGHLTSCC